MRCAEKVAPLLVTFAAEFHEHIEPIDEGQLDDWGYCFRNVRGSSDNLSNHSSGTAIDLNATKHPLGHAGTVATENAGIEIERGTQTNTALLWNEGTDRWTFSNDGSTYFNIPVTSDLTLNATTTNGASTDNDIVIGGLTVSGSAQAKSDHFVIYCSTTDATTTEMFLNGTSGRITLPTNSAASFKGQITAFELSTMKAASWHYDCLIANKNGSTAIVNYAHVTKIGDDSGNVWEVYVDGENATDSLKLQVKGQASATIKWTASVISTVVL